MPHWHHHCYCPHHRRGHPCPYCDDPDYWRGTREPPEEPRETDTDRGSQQRQRRRESVERLAERVDGPERT